jgi:hypothetical protein
MQMNAALISEKLSKIDLLSLGRSTGFIRSTAQKITPSAFVLAFFVGIGHHARFSLSNWAEYLKQVSGNSVSKQAVEQRTAGFRHVKFVKALLEQILFQKVALEARDKQAPPCGFARILVVDSTCLKLPRWLAGFLPGAHSKYGNPTATGRIQLTMDLRQEQMLDLAVTSYRENDQSYAGNILKHIKQGDLLLQDQGYFKLDLFQAIQEQGGCFLSRLRPGVSVFWPGQHEAFDLLKELKKRSRKKLTSFEVLVEIGRKQRILVRLIVRQLPQDVYQRRRRKAKKDRHSKANHSNAYLELLRWQLLITNAPAEQLPREKAWGMYRLRWRIEIVFKCWKQEFQLQRIFQHDKRMKATRAMIMIYLYLAYLALIMTHHYYHANRLVFEQTGRFLSLLKWCQCCRIHGLELLDQYAQEHWIQHLARNATYERRTDRKNHWLLMYEHAFA